MKFIKITFLILLPALLLAQQPGTDDIPTAVKKKFNRMFPRAENIDWDKVDTVYKADFFDDKVMTYVEISPKGDWLMTITSLNTKELYAPIEKYLDENFKKDKIVLAEKCVQANKQDYYYVQLERVHPETKEDYIAELFFDRTGRIEQVRLPDGVNEMTVVGLDNPNSEIPAKVIDSWQKRFPKSEDIDWVVNPNPNDTIEKSFTASFVYRDQDSKAEFLEDGTLFETRTNLDKKNLYAPIAKYLDANYSNGDIVFAEKIKPYKGKSFYRIELEQKNKGKDKPYLFEMFFSQSGQIEKINRPQELVNQYLLTVDVPPAVAKKFKSRFARAEDVTWETKEGNWLASFVYREQPSTAEFSDTATWVETIQQLDLKNIYSPIQRSLDDKFKDYKVTYGEKVTRKDRKDYYYLELVAKKKNVSPNKMGVTFDKTGRLKEEK